MPATDAVAAPEDKWPGPAPTAQVLLIWLDDPNPTDMRVAASAIALTRQGKFATAAEEVDCLTREGYRPRADCAPVVIKPPVDWQMDPFGDRNWRAQLNMLRLVDPFIRAHEQTREPRYLRQAFEYCLDWGRYHQDPKHLHPHAWVDMVVGTRSQRLSYLAERLRAKVFETTPAERALFALLLADHWKQLTSTGFLKYNNHTIVDLHGLMSLARSTLSTDAIGFAWESALGKRLDRLIASQFNARGVHLENSPSYQFVAKNMFRTLHRSGWYARTSPKLARTLERAASIETWMRLPDGRLVALGDTDGEAPLSGIEPLSCRPASSVAQIETINHSGYCFVRSVPAIEPAEWSFLGIKAGFEVITHRHQDDLSCVWSESGWDIVVDAGKYSYDNHPMRHYARSSRGHSVIEFEGRDFNSEPNHRTGHLTRAVVKFPWGVRVDAEWTHQPAGIQQRRSFFFSPGRWLIVRDEFTSNTAVSFIHRTLLAPEFDVALVRDKFMARHSSGKLLGIDTLSSVAVRKSVHKGKTEPAMEGWISRKYRQMQPSPTLALSGKASQATLIVALSLVEEGAIATEAGGTAIWRTPSLSLRIDGFDD